MDRICMLRGKRRRQNTNKHIPDGRHEESRVITLEIAGQNDFSEGFDDKFYRCLSGERGQRNRVDGCVRGFCFPSGLFEGEKSCGFDDIVTFGRVSQCRGSARGDGCRRRQRRRSRRRRRRRRYPLAPLTDALLLSPQRKDAGLVH
jgi:hypothetical protein